MYDFGTEVREAFFEKAIATGDKSFLKGAYSSFAEWRDLSDVGEWEYIEEAIEWVHDRQVIQKPYKNSASVLTRLNWTHEIKYVTSRKDKYYDSTTYWLNMWQFPVGELICSDHDKSEHLEDCQILIDDRPRTIVNFIKKEENKAFGLWSPYNRNLTDIRHVYLAPTWRGLEVYLEKTKILPYHVIHEKF